MTDKTKWVIVDKITGSILKDKVYVHRGTAESQIKRGGFYLPRHEPVVVGLDSSLMKKLANVDAIMSGSNHKGGVVN